MQGKKLIPNQRLRYVRELRGWSQAKLAELVDATTISVSRWETGATSPGPYHREKLCQLFNKNAEELGFIFTDENASSEGPSPVDAIISTPQLQYPHSYIGNGISQEENVHWKNMLWPATIPNEYYYALPGRESELTQLSGLLREPQGPPIVVVDGLGGMGKTAFAAELTRRVLKEKLFSGVVGESARLEDFAGGEIVMLREAILDFDKLLNAIARQLGHWGIPTLQAEEKRVAILNLLRQQPYIIFVDNLETAENANAIVTHLRSFLGESRAIITSRKQIRHHFVQRCSLQGLSEEDALVFLNMDIQQRPLPVVSSLTDAQLKNIYQVTGGAPLAMKLVLAQAAFLDLNVVLRQLSSTSNEQLYTFVFRRSWDHLLPVAQKILYYIGKTAVTRVDWEELVSVGIVEDEITLMKGIDQLVLYSLLEVSSLSDEKWYSIHQLTRQFLNGELPKLWQGRDLP